MFPHGSSGCSHKLRQSSHAVGSCGNFFRSPFFPLSTAKGRCLQQLLAVHFDSRHRNRPMSSRLLFTMSGTMCVPVAVVVPGRLSRSLSRRDRTWCHHQNWVHWIGAAVVDQPWPVGHLRSLFGPIRSPPWTSPCQARIGPDAFRPSFGLGSFLSGA